jgi:HAD superfamily hydrolase (TIGR01490 family)
MTAKKFAAFDIDGTLIRWQLYHAVVDMLADKGHLGLDAKEQIYSKRMAWKRREQVDAYDNYELFLLKTYEQSLQKLKPLHFDSCVDEVISLYKDQVYTYTRDKVEEFRDKGYFLLAISGSHHELVEKIAKVYRFNDCLGTKYHRQNQVFTGAKTAPSLDKASALRALVRKHGLTFSGSLAIGDSASDIAMLELVDQPVAFNPARQLFDYAKNQGWKIVIERKSVVFKLEVRRGVYQLIS